MRLTSVHATFWQQRRGPKWARSFDRPHSRPTNIDLCVNEHAGYRPTEGQVAMHNLLVLLRHVRRRNEDVRAYLHRLSVEPGTIIRPEKRAAYAKRLLKRLNPK